MDACASSVCQASLDAGEGVPDLRRLMPMLVNLLLAHREASSALQEQSRILHGETLRDRQMVTRISSTCLFVFSRAEEIEPAFSSATLRSEALALSNSVSRIEISRVGQIFPLNRLLVFGRHCR